MKALRSLLAIFALSLVLAGCSTTPSDDAVTTEETPAVESAVPAVDAEGAVEVEVTEPAAN